MTKHLQKGFTLAEVLITIFIIGLILGIGVPIVANVLKDSSTEEFVSNAKIVEDALSMYYKDNGVLSSSETVSEIDDMSRKIILSRLVKEGVTEPEQVLDKLIADGKLKKVDFNSLKEYTKLDESVEGAKYFIFIDIVNEDELDESYGVYENDIAGYVFSTETRDKTSGLVYSGAHSLTKEESDKVQGSIDEINKGNEQVFKKGMNPYGFKLVDFTDNKNGTVDLMVTWTNRIVDDKNNLDTFKGFIATDFVITCNLCDNGNTVTYDLDKDKSYAVNSKNTTVEQKGNNFIMTIKNVTAGKLVMTLKDDKIFYAGKDTGKVTKIGYLNGKPSSDYEQDLKPEVVEDEFGNKCWDTNGDGKPDICDTDGDGFPDAGYPSKPGLGVTEGNTGTIPPPWENAPGFDLDGDGVDDAWDLDGDGIPDAWDTDGDGLPDAWDTDGDGKPDAWDTRKPALGCPNEWDRDGDGKVDAWDTDGDCKPDAWDTDGDGLPDAWDTDGDGKPDAWDTSVPKDGKPDIFDTDGDGIPDTSDKDGDGLPDTKPGNGDGDGDGSLDLEGGIITDGEKEKFPVCDTCGIDEIIPDFAIDDLWKQREELNTFGKNSVVPVFEGLKIKNLDIGDYIVLKEYKKSGNIFVIDNNRTRLFKATSKDILIPKNPYLQNDFQTNVNTSFIYVIEAYKPKLVNNSDAKSPLHAIEILYEK